VDTARRIRHTRHHAGAPRLPGRFAIASTNHDAADTTHRSTPETLGAGAARQARVLARLSRAPERSRSARSPARWTECTEAYGPRPWRGSAAGAVNVRGYLSTGAQRKRSQNPRSAGVLVR